MLIAPAATHLNQHITEQPTVLPGFELGVHGRCWRWA